MTKRKVVLSIAIVLICCTALFAYLAYNISNKRLYRITWGGVTDEFLQKAKTNPDEFKITKEPSIIIVDNRPETSENYYSVSELETSSVKGMVMSVQLFTYEEYQKFPYFSATGPETMRYRTKQQTFFFIWLTLSVICFLGSIFFFVYQSKIDDDLYQNET